LMSFMSYVHAFLNRFSQGLYSQPTSYGAYVAIFQVGIGWFYLIEQKPIAAGKRSSVVLEHAPVSEHYPS